MIRPVDTTLLDAVKKTTPSAPAQTAAAEAGGKTAFATQLKRESQKAAETTAASAGVKPEADSGSKVLDRTTPPEGEKWRPVKGRDDYAEIISGERKGQYVNLNRGARRGDAFTIEEREGKTVHIYKKADGSELVVPIEGSKEAKAAGSRVSDREPPKGETWGPVDGKRAYADILSGPRNGYYINLQQGSVREGEVFHIVKRAGKEFHVYGEGDDKVWVEVGPTKKKKASESAGNAATTESTTPASGTPDSRDASQNSSTPAAASTGGTAAERR